MIAVVVVVVVVGGEQLLYMALPKVHVWSKKLKSKTLTFAF